MNALNITTDTDGKITEVKIDDKVIDNASDVTQTLVRGELVATIKATFGNITVTEQSGTPAPSLTVTFEAGTVAGSTKATITDTVGDGDHFAYIVGSSTQSTPNIGDAIVGSTTYVSGNNITGVVEGNSVAIYELTADNKAVKFIAHTLIAANINAGS